MAKMKEGECGCTKKGVEYCYTPKGVRFTGKKCEVPAVPKTEEK